MQSLIDLAASNLIVIWMKSNREKECLFKLALSEQVNVVINDLSLCMI